LCVRDYLACARCGRAHECIIYYAAIPCKACRPAQLQPRTSSASSILFNDCSVGTMHECCTNACWLGWQLRHWPLCAHEHVPVCMHSGASGTPNLLQDDAHHNHVLHSCVLQEVDLPGHMRSSGRRRVGPVQQLAGAKGYSSAQGMPCAAVWQERGRRDSRQPRPHLARRKALSAPKKPALHCTPGLTPGCQHTML